MREGVGPGFLTELTPTFIIGGRMYPGSLPYDEVKRLVERHVKELDAKIADMQAMRRTLVDLARHCHGDHRPECPIIEDLAEGRA